MAQAPTLDIAQAADCLRAGGVIAYPTEAVFGLGCDPGNEAAVRKILAMKSRSQSAGLILLADSFDRLAKYSGDISPELMARAEATWPGPVTWLFPRRPGIPDWLAGSHPTVALRVTSHPVCRALCRAFGGALVSTSANPSTRPPARTAGQVSAWFGGSIEGIVAGELGGEQNPSEIRELLSGAVIRPA